MLALNESKIKYEKLDELFGDLLFNIKFSQQVNIVIDLKEVIKKFFRPDLAPNIESNRLLIEELSADIINIISHYRNYFYKKNKYTTFFFLYSYNECEEFKKIFPNYKKEYYEKYFNSSDNSEKIALVKKAIQVSEKVINKIPNAYFVDTSNYDEFLYVRFIIENSKESDLNILLSNDTIFYQLLNSHTVLLNIKGIKSSLVKNNNAISILTKKETNLTSAILPLLIALSGNEKYSIEGLPHVALIKATKIIESLIEREIMHDAESIKFPIEAVELNEKNKIDTLILSNIENLSKSYSLIRGDDIYFANKLNFGTALLPKKSGTRETFLELNSKFFSMFPLQLDMFLKGEKV